MQSYFCNVIRIIIKSMRCRIPNIKTRISQNIFEVIIFCLLDILF